jgi:broad specificity phosphatase PhoE
MLRLTLLCHGATAATRAAAFPLDEPLEPAAHTAAQALARALAATSALTSPALRTRQTADAVGVEPRIDPALRDCDYGRWAGQAMRTVAEREPEAFAAFISDPSARPHGGESIADLRSRAAAWLEAQLPGKGRLLAVTHASFMRAAIVATLSSPLEAFWRIDIPPLATAELVSDGRRWTWWAAAAPRPRPRPAADPAAEPR